METITLFLYVLGLALTLAAAWIAAVSDFRNFRIPNICSVMAIGGFTLAALGGVIGGEILPLGAFYGHIISGLLVFAVTFILFLARTFGAGDAKFISALSLWFMPSQLTLFVFIVALAGGVLGIITIAMARLKPLPHPPSGTWLASAQAGQNRVPYGIAISLGFVAAAWMLGYLGITEITIGMKAVE